MDINKKTIIAMMVVYGIARGVVDNLKPLDGDEAVASDTTVFNEVVKSLLAKESEANNGK